MRALLLSLALAACATVSPAPRGAESISYETGPCLGTCPFYKVTVNADGAGIFEGRRFTAVTGERHFRLTRAQYQAFASHLAPVRPASDQRYWGPPLCGQMATDQISVEVVWRSPADDERRLFFYYGCDLVQNRALRERLAAAPHLLPIGDFIRPAR